MIELIRNLNREDIYYGIIPLLIFIIPYLHNFFHPLKLENGWRGTVKKGSFDRYITLQLRIWIYIYIMTIIVGFFGILCIEYIVYSI